MRHVIEWDHTPWYLRIFGFPAFRRRVVDSWEYYNEKLHGRGLWM